MTPVTILHIEGIEVILLPQEQIDGKTNIVGVFRSKQNIYLYIANSWKLYVRNDVKLKILIDAISQFQERYIPIYGKTVDDYEVVL
jgi:hypothetical protein